MTVSTLSYGIKLGSVEDQSFHVLRVRAESGGVFTVICQTTKNGPSVRLFPLAASRIQMEFAVRRMTDADWCIEAIRNGVEASDDELIGQLLVSAAEGSRWGVPIVPTPRGQVAIALMQAIKECLFESTQVFGGHEEESALEVFSDGELAAESFGISFEEAEAVALTHVRVSGLAFGEPAHLVLEAVAEDDDPSRPVFSGFLVDQRSGSTVPVMLVPAKGDQPGELRCP